MDRTRVPATVALVIVAGALGGCAAEAGMGLPTLTPGDRDTVLVQAPRGTASVTGALSVAGNGCFHWAQPGSPADGAWVVWPDDARQDGAEVVLDGGDRIGDGDGVRGEGGIVMLDDLPEGAEEQSYFGSFGRFCDADERGVLVLVTVAAQNEP